MVERMVHSAAQHPACPHNAAYQSAPGDGVQTAVLDVYADYPNWPRLFPTISAVRVLGRHGPKAVAPGQGP